MKKLLTVYLLLLAGMAQGQDLFQGSLFPADLIMKNRDKISLSDQQADKIKAIHSKNAGEFSTLRWDLDAENEKLKKMLQEPKINADAAQKQMDKILNLENQLKKRQFSNLLAIRGELNEKQATELASISKKTTSTWVMHNSGSGQGVGATSVNGAVIRGTKNATAYTFDGEKGNFTTIRLRKSGDMAGKEPLMIINGDIAGKEPLMIIKHKDKDRIIKDINSINPDEIESIEVLKDSKAMIEYGDEGKNGVIIITLKKDNNYNFEK